MELLYVAPYGKGKGDYMTLFERVKELEEKYDKNSCPYIYSLLNELEPYRVDYKSYITTEQWFELEGHKIYIETYGDELIDIAID